MKLLFCQECEDLVVPSPKNLEIRWCHCGRHQVWWRDGALGILRVADVWYGQIVERRRRLKAEGQLSEDSPSWEPRAFVIGIHNSLLLHPRSRLDKADIEKLIEQTPDSYIFKQLRSLIIRIRPGESGDTAWVHMRPWELSG